MTTFPGLALRIEGLSKRYENHIAVNARNLRCPRDASTGSWSPTSAGRAPRPRCPQHHLARSGQRCDLRRRSVSDRTILRCVGYLPEERGLDKSMSVLEVIVFFARLKGVAASTARATADQWLEHMSLGDWRHAKVEALSKGMQQKVQFIATVAHEPDLPRSMNLAPGSIL